VGCVQFSGFEIRGVPGTGNREGRPTRKASPQPPSHSIATLLALGTLLSSAGVLVGLAGLAIFGLCLWLARGYQPDVAAGLQLRTHKVREVWFDGAPWQVADVGFLQSHIRRDAAVHCRQNRLMHDARYHGEARQVAAR
jgi:hypothetical protein